MPRKKRSSGRKKPVAKADAASKQAPAKVDEVSNEEEATEMEIPVEADQAVPTPPPEEAEMEPVPDTEASTSTPTAETANHDENGPTEVGNENDVEMEEGQKEGVGKGEALSQASTVVESEPDETTNPLPSAVPTEPTKQLQSMGELPTDNTEDNVNNENIDAEKEEGAAQLQATSPIPSTSGGNISADEDADPSEFIDAILTNHSYLIDPKGSYRDETNLKMPLTYFAPEDETKLFPVIESMSAKLFNIVQKMMNCQKNDVERSFKSRKGFVKLKNKLQLKAYLCKVNLMEVPPAPKKPAMPKRAPHPFLLQEDENLFTEEKLKLLRATLDAGWKREVVMRSSGSTGRKTGDVYYYSPGGVKYRSSKQVAQYLSELPDTPFTLDNFSFAKVRVSTNPDQEIVRKAYDGKSPPRSPPKPCSSKSRPPPTPPPKHESSKAAAVARPSTSKDFEVETRPSIEEPVAKVSTSRRSIQPPKRYSGDAVLLLPKRSKMDDKHRNSNSKGLMQMGMLPPKYPKGMEDTSSTHSEGNEYDPNGQAAVGAANSVAIKEIAEDSLFQISALRQSGGIDVDSMHRYVANQKQIAQQKAAAKEMERQRPVPGGSSGPKRGDGSVICSIRCPGMDGIVPNLQCTRCLCLFHADCLGLPPNLQISKYVCTTCLDAPSPAASTGGNAYSPKNMGMKKPVEVPKRQPPGLAPIPHTVSPVRRPVAAQGHNRDVTSPMAVREHAGMSLPRRGGPSGRGMMRGRGGAMISHMRASPTQVHAQRIKVPEGAHLTVMSSPPHVVKRGRGRPPSIPSRQLPQLNKNVSIQSLPRFQMAPPVPNLQPMMGAPKPVHKLQMPPMPVKQRAGVPALPTLIKSSAFRLTVPPPSLSGRTFKKISPQPAPAATNLRLTSSSTIMIPRGAPVPPQVQQAQLGQPSQQAQATQQQLAHATQVHVGPKIVAGKRYAQSVCTIGGKKYVVLPKKNRVNTEVIASSSLVAAVGNGGIPVNSRTSYTIIDGVIQRNETVVKRAETLSTPLMAENNTNSSDKTMAVREEMDGQSVVESVANANNSSGSAEASSFEPMDGVEEQATEVNSTNEAVAANQLN